MQSAQVIPAIRSSVTELRRPAGKPAADHPARSTRPEHDRDRDHDRERDRHAPAPSLAAGLRRRRGHPNRLRRRPLSHREVEVLVLIADGLSKEQAGRRLGISGPTVKSHLSRIYSALGAVNSAHAVAIAHCRGEIGPRGARTPRNPGLSWRETQVLAAVAAGLTVEEVGRTMYLSPHTVKSHLHHVYTKLGAGSRAAAVDRAFCCGVFVVQEPAERKVPEQRHRSAVPVAA
jgi:DNA-binding CsgD family transcriptional regulator